MHRPLLRFAALAVATASTAAAQVPAALSAPPPAAPQATVTAGPPPDARLYAVAAAPQATRIERDIRALAGFGTRNTFSDTVSSTRGIGAARRYLKAQLAEIGRACGDCLEVVEQRTYVPGGTGERIPRGIWIVNVYAIQRGTERPGHYAVMSGDIDSRGTAAVDSLKDAPGANDNASGAAGVLEAARVLTRYRFPNSIVYALLSGEEQGLFGGQHLARRAADEGWNVLGVLNNDMIGNTCGISGQCSNQTFRVFSEPTPVTETDRQRASRRFYGGEVDGPSRQLARYVDRLADAYFDHLDARMIYRLDRFGRGGHHRPFNDQGFPGVRIMETHEHYDRQHQDLRTENGRHFGDTVEFVDFAYAARLTGINAVVLASLASAPPPPARVRIGGAVSANTTLDWDAVPDAVAYALYWRDTTEPQWTHRRVVHGGTRFTLENVVIDDFLFGVAAIGPDGNESLVVFPTEVGR